MSPAQLFQDFSQNPQQKNENWLPFTSSLFRLQLYLFKYVKLYQMKPLPVFSINTCLQPIWVSNPLNSFSEYTALVVTISIELSSSVIFSMHLSPNFNLVCLFASELFFLKGAFGSKESDRL